MKTQTQEQLVSPKEAIHLYQYATVVSVYLAKEIAEEYAKTKHISLANQPFEFFVLLSLLLETGRIQGIRQERQKRK